MNASVEARVEHERCEDGKLHAARVDHVKVEAGNDEEAAEKIQDDVSIRGLNLDNVKDLLDESLNEIGAAGSFASFGTIPHFVDPILIVDDQAPIRLPLQAEDAVRIRAASHQAPFGQGSATIVDESVRKTWELNWGDFRLLDSGFDHLVSRCVNEAGAQLGISPNECKIVAQPYKLLLYEQGAHFKAHTDTVKAPGMFGTMVICLPSAHEGGDLVLRHKGAEKRFSTSMHQPSLACWFSDVTHEICEVTSGYRLVMTFNLIQLTRLCNPLSASAQRDQCAQLERALRAWMYQTKDAKSSSIMAHELAYILDHKYTESGLGLGVLKGTDKARVQALQLFANRCNYDIFLATLEHYEHGAADADFWDVDEEDEEDEDRYEPIEEVLNSETTLKRVVSLEGVLLLTDAVIDEDRIVQGEPWLDQVPDQHSFQAYTGNEGAQSSHWYRDTVGTVAFKYSMDRIDEKQVVVLVQRDKLSNFLIAPFRRNEWTYEKRDIKPVLNRLLQDCSLEAADCHLKAALSDVCKYVLTTMRAARTTARQGSHSSSRASTFDDGVLTHVIEAVVKIGSFDLAITALACSQDRLPPATYETIGTFVESMDLERLKRLLRVPCMAQTA